MIRDTNITGYSKLKKSEIIDKMMKEDERFKQYVLKNHTTPKTPIKKTTTHKMPDGKIMSGKTHKKDSKEIKPKIPTITITEAPKEKKKKEPKEIITTAPPPKNKRLKLFLHNPKKQVRELHKFYDDLELERIQDVVGKKNRNDISKLIKPIIDETREKMNLYVKNKDLEKLQELKSEFGKRVDYAINNANKKRDRNKGELPWHEEHIRAVTMQTKEYPYFSNTEKLLGKKLSKLMEYYRNNPKKEVKKEVKKPEVKKEPKKEPKKLIPKFDFDSSKINIKEKTNKSNDKYYDIYYEYNNVYIEAAITHSKQFYLDTFEAQSDEDKPRAPKGMANYYLCELLKSLIKNTKLNLKTSSDFTLSAGNIVESGFNQEKLNKYYEGLGFKKDGPINKSKNQDYKQSISSFLKNCEKFEKK